MIQACFSQIKALVDKYAATHFVVDVNVSFETRLTPCSMPASRWWNWTCRGDWRA